jgi:SAM-dependent methyltransferase
MLIDKGSEEDLARVTREREEADRLYNDALTKLDNAIARPREFPQPPPGYDETQITPLNQRWELLSLKPEEGTGWFTRVRAHAWSMVAPLFERQQAFNSALVDHVNRNIAHHRETVRAMETTLSMLRDDHLRLIQYQTLLILYAQQITPYIDTKDRQVVSLVHSLAAGLSGVSDEMQKRWESFAASGRRSEAREKSYESTISVMQRAIQSMKRELERNLGAMGAAGAIGAAGAPAAMGAAGAIGAIGAVDSYKYVGFEDRFRGSQIDIRVRLESYLPLFDGASDVLDVGCGRGEFLDLLRTRGISARGIDLNDEMAALTRERGLDAVAGDALTYLESLPDESLGGLFAAQVVEHLEPAYLMRFLDTSYHKLRPGSKIVLETINVSSWYAFFSSYIRDVTHAKPLHPETLQYLVGASGFQNVAIRFSAPLPEQMKLQPVALEGGTNAEETLNENARRLNELLFGDLDYAIIGERK